MPSLPKSSTGHIRRLKARFEEAGVPGPPPDLPHQSKWKTWLRRAGTENSVDSLAVVGRLIEEFMDLPPPPPADVLGIGYDPVAEYNRKRTRLNTVLEEHGFRYFSGGRVLPNDAAQSDPTPITSTPDTMAPPSSGEFRGPALRIAHMALHLSRSTSAGGAESPRLVAGPEGAPRWLARHSWARHLCPLTTSRRTSSTLR